MKLRELKLSNFQGIKRLDVDFKGESVNVYGDNATGKTTVYNAFTWTLFDKASTGAKGFSPKTKGKDGDLHGLDHSAEVVLELETGQKISYKKVFKEVYTKKRGTAQEVFSGHTTDFYIDGLPVKEKEYTESIQRVLGDAETLKMLTMPFYVAEDMHWKERRNLLLEVCGDVADDDVIASNSELAELKGLLLIPNTLEQYYELEDFQAKTVRAMSEINKSLASIPDRIDEAERAKEELEINSGFDQALEDLAEEKTKAELKRLDILSSNKASLEIKREIEEKELEIKDAKRAYDNNLLIANQKRRADEFELERPISEIRTSLAKANEDLEDKKREKARLEAQRERVLAEFDKVVARVWQGEEVCYACKRPLDEKEVEEAKANFLLQRSKDLDRINEEGKEYSKERIEEVKNDIIILESTIKSIEDKREVLLNSLASFKQTEIATELFEDTKEAQKLGEELKLLLERKNDVRALVEERTQKIDEDLEIIKSEIAKHERLKARALTNERQDERIAELQAEETRLARQYQEEQKALYLCELFTRQKVSMLDDKINSVFNRVRFQLFIEQVNGGVREDCEVLVPAEDGRLVPFALANNAGKINAGLEIIDTLAKHLGKSMPLFVDNAESVTKLQKTDAQVIRLIVSEQDKILRFEEAI